MALADRGRHTPAHVTADIYCHHRRTAVNWTTLGVARTLARLRCRRTPSKKVSVAKILVLHGPNLNLLGSREPAIYGTDTLVQIDQRLATQARAAGHELECLQSNAEHELVDRVQRAGSDGTAFILVNAAAFTHTSVALRDALAGVALPVVEVHISNVHKREEFRHHSYISAVADGVIAGLGIYGYAAALRYLAGKLGT
jgi:3-dehydroquinate dehydratase-2